MSEKIYASQEYVSTKISEAESSLDDKLTTKANASHAHAIADVTDLQSTLDTKMNTVPVTSADNGKFLRVVNGAWAAATVLNAEEASF